MKICSKCKQEKDESEFGKSSRRKDGLQAYCKSCRKEYDANHFQKNKEKILEHHHNRRQEKLQWFEDFLADKKCINCGEDHPATLQFHHRNASEKEHNVSDMLGPGYAISTLLKEIEKCDILCANCHSKMHWKS